MCTKAASLLLTILFLLLPAIAISTQAQSGTTGSIAGTVKDQNGSVIAGAEVTVVSKATGDERRVTTDSEGNYALSLLPPGEYRVTVAARGFNTALFDSVRVVITETTRVDANGPHALAVSEVITNPIVVRIAPLIQRDGPQLGRVVDSRMVSELPLATRNFTQILGLSPGTSMELPDNTAVGRNSQMVSVNGARATQNNYQINGVDANNIRNNNAVRLAVPAPETIQEFKVQTSLYDATFGRSAGGNIQAVTQSGANDFHGAAYEYFLNEALTANNPFLKAAGVNRPVLERNIFGGVLGGRLKRDKAFFFTSYQGTREQNAASDNSLTSSVLIAEGLTDDRSEQTLLSTFRPRLPNALPASAINPVALALLNLKLPHGKFLIPTPQADGRYSGATPSSYREDQFNFNVDYRVNQQNWLTTKFFFSNAPQTLALFTGVNVPGFAAEQQTNNRLISIQDIHSFSSTLINEARAGYNFIRQASFPQEPVKDSDVGIRRANADTFPGLPLIRIAPNAGGIAFGTATANIDLAFASSSATLFDTLSLTRGNHRLRSGAELIYYQLNITSNINTWGQIDFNSFNDFLVGTVSQSIFGSGIADRSLRATDYGFFIQDDWKFSRKLTINLGLRYELDLPPYDTRGRNVNFDPARYAPRLEVGSNGNPIGPPSSGFVQAGNVIPQYDMPNVPNVGKRVSSSDQNNFAPRVGFAYSPLDSNRVVVRGGYGIFFSRLSFLYIPIILPPNYVVGRRANPPFTDPFFVAPATNEFPTFVRGIDVSTPVFDLSLSTPYSQQYNSSVQYAINQDTSIELAYVGSHGLNLQRDVGINQARLASPQHPIVNEVLLALNLPGAIITTNTPTNAQLRAPFQGASTLTFRQQQTTAQSSYNSLQVSLNSRLTKGSQFLAAYTFAKSVDNGSGGALNSGAAVDTAVILGNQLDNRAHRGVSNFDRTHRFVLSYLWDLPRPAFAARSSGSRMLLSNWQVAGIITAMSGLPIDIVDGAAGSFYGLNGGNNPLARPSWAPDATRSVATTNIPPGYFFNPFAFARPTILAGQLIPSSNGTAQAGAIGTDLGNVGRNVLRGPAQTNVDFSISKRFPFGESHNIEFRAAFFNLFNHVNLANPISNLNAVQSSGGSIDQNSGRIINPGDFGRIVSTSNNPRLIQFALKFNY
jgi:hypothetical protein